MNDYISKKTDLHIHTTASDGELSSGEVIELAYKKRLKYISITDHDSIKGYKDPDYDCFKSADNRGITLLSGIELDSLYKGIEVHILGYGIDIDNSELNEYLKNVSYQRKRRITEQIDTINTILDKKVLERDEVLRDYRDIYMKPHLILALQNIEYFKDLSYKDISKWVAKNIKVKTEVDKPDSKEIVEMIKYAGGKAFLAHPGYYIYYQTINIDELLTELKTVGLEGIELDYPYSGSGSEINKIREKEIYEIIENKSIQYKLFPSRGSDTHDEKRFLNFNK